MYLWHTSLKYIWVGPFFVALGIGVLLITAALWERSQNKQAALQRFIALGPTQFAMADLVSAKWRALYEHKLMAYVYDHNGTEWTLFYLVITDVYVLVLQDGTHYYSDKCVTPRALKRPQLANTETLRDKLKRITPS